MAMTIEELETIRAALILSDSCFADAAELIVNREIDQLRSDQLSKEAGRNPA